MACEIGQYYDTVVCALNTKDLQCITVMEDFNTKWKALMDKKRAHEPQTPKISKILNIMK